MLSNMQRYQDSMSGVLYSGQAALNDTMYDFIFSSLGNAIVCVFGYYKLKYKKKLKLMVKYIESEEKNS
ncbi:MAG TPA: hypothetical protein VJZ51_02190 [Bacilli bacterium]|nr:hypothetical protein [Bacilli bacterium]